MGLPCGGSNLCSADHADGRTPRSAPPGRTPHPVLTAMLEVPIFLNRSSCSTRLSNDGTSSADGASTSQVASSPNATAREQLSSTARPRNRGRNDERVERPLARGPDHARRRAAGGSANDRHGDGMHWGVRPYQGSRHGPTTCHLGGNDHPSAHQVHRRHGRAALTDPRGRAGRPRLRGVLGGGVLCSRRWNAGCWPLATRPPAVTWTATRAHAGRSGSLPPSPRRWPSTSGPRRTPEHSPKGLACAHAPMAMPPRPCTAWTEQVATTRITAGLKQQLRSPARTQGATRKDSRGYGQDFWWISGVAPVGVLARSAPEGRLRPASCRPRAAASGGRPQGRP
jgi:hypothetical protein